MTPAITFDHVTLWRRTQEEFAYDLKGTLFRLLQRKYRRVPRRRTLDDVTFTVAAGEKVAIIGRNGSGKSTLLKVAAGILSPTSGSAHVNGMLAALIELGAGFDGDLTLVENIIYYGVLLGFSRSEMKARVGKILRFAELEDHANAPLKTLSSGMSARLSFAIATDVRPDVLLIDEVLSVGDEAFRQRSADRMQQFWNEHSTIVVVSHDLSYISQNCERAIWLDAGRVIADGAAVSVAERYAAAAHAPVSDDVPRSHEAAFGHVDQVEFNDGELFVRGWGVLEHRRRGSAVRILVDGVMLGEASYGLPRPDVAVAFSDLDPFVGFEASLICDLDAREHKVECVVFDAGAGVYRSLPEQHAILVASSRERAPL